MTVPSRVFFGLRRPLTAWPAAVGIAPLVVLLCLTPYAGLAHAAAAAPHGPPTPGVGGPHPGLRSPSVALASGRSVAEAPPAPALADSPRPSGNADGVQGFSWDPLRNLSYPGVVTGWNGQNIGPMAYDPIQRTLWVGFGGSNFSLPATFSGLNPPVLMVVDPASGQVIDVLTGYFTVLSIAFDPADGDMYASYVTAYYARGNGSVAVFNASDDSVVNSNISVGAVPVSLLYDPATGEMWVGDLYDAEIQVISSANYTVVGTLAYRQFAPFAMAYDPLDGDVYALDLSGSVVRVLNGTTGTLLGHAISDPGDAGGIQFDASTGYLYVYAAGMWSYNTAIEVIDGSTQSSVAQVAMPGGHRPVSVAIDPATGNLWVALDNAAVVGMDGATFAVSNSTATVGPNPWSAVADPATGEAYFAEAFGTELAPINLSTGQPDEPTVPLASEPTQAVWDPANGRAVLPDPAHPGLLNLDPSTGDGAGSPTPVGDTPLGAPLRADPIAVTFAASSNELFVATAPPGPVWVLNATTEATVEVDTALRNTTALAYSSADGHLYAGLANGSLLRVDPQTLDSQRLVGLDGSIRSILVDDAAGTVWALGNAGSLCGGFLQAVYTSNDTVLNVSLGGFGSGQIALDAAADSVFLAAPPCGANPALTDYSASNGTAGPAPTLPFGNAWAVAYDPVNQRLYVGDQYAPSVAVLPAGTLNATLSNVTLISVSGPPNWLGEVGPDGTVLGISNTSAVVEGITLAPVVVSALAAPNPLDAGSLLHLRVAAGGGAGKFSYLYSGLPAGCPSENAANWSCAPTAPGVFTGQVQVTDQAGGTASRSFPITVTAPPTVAVVATPAAAALGSPIGFTTVTAGGVGPLTVSWTFGDGGEAQGPAATHIYAAPGRFDVTVQASDLLGVTASANTTVLIGAPLSLLALAAPLSVVLDGQVEVNATPAGGTAPYTVAASFGDGGSALEIVNSSGASALLVHHYAVSGTFTLHVEATDAAGIGRGENFTVTVANATVPGPVAAGVPWLLIGVSALGAANAVAGALLVWVVYRRRRRTITGVHSPGGTVPPSEPPPPG